MRKGMLTIGFVVLLSLMLSSAQSEQRRAGAANCSCAETALRDIRSVKVGMTRKDIEKVLTTEGGISARGARTYVYKNCAYIKVDVQFQAIQHPGEKLKEFSDDKIIGMSKPYLDNPILD